MVARRIVDVWLGRIPKPQQIRHQHSPLHVVDMLQHILLAAMAVAQPMQQHQRSTATLVKLYRQTMGAHCDSALLLAEQAAKRTLEVVRSCAQIKVFYIIKIYRAVTIAVSELFELVKLLGTYLIP